MAVTKNEWQRPELIVLTRSTPEEAVLGGCKVGNGIGPMSNSCTTQDCFKIQNS